MQISLCAISDTISRTPRGGDCTYSVWLPPLKLLQSFYWLQKASEICHSNTPQAREAFFFFFVP